MFSFASFSDQVIAAELGDNTSISNLPLPVEISHNNEKTVYGRQQSSELVVWHENLERLLNTVLFVAFITSRCFSFKKNCFHMKIVSFNSISYCRGFSKNVQKICSKLLQIMSLNRVIKVIGTK